MPVTDTHSRTLAVLAAQLGAVMHAVDDAGARKIACVASPGTAHADSLLFAEDEKSLRTAEAVTAAAILLSPALHVAAPPQPGSTPRLLAQQPKLAFARAAKMLQPETTSHGIHPSAVIDPSAQLDAGVAIGPLTVIEADVRIGPGTRIDAGVVVGRGCIVGADCHLYPRVVLYPGTSLGARVLVHAGAVLGSDGFGYVRDSTTGAYTQFPQQGSLVIEDDVEIGANSTLDRGALEETRLARGVKIDNLVHIGHNVSVGADVVIAAQTGISGSSSIGAGAIVAGQVGIADHVTIGPGAILGAQCGVPSRKRIEGPGTLFWGTPARPIQQYLKELALLARLARPARRNRQQADALHAEQPGEHD
jgi:UDP-3-O-[3-hydroxymyristoyl] glucosamine N-acyltransferase